MPFKSSKAFETSKFVEVQRSSKNKLGQGIGGSGGAGGGPGIAAITATGGTITTKVASDGKTYKIHTFTTPGPNPFSVSAADPTATAYVYVQAGGGGGGGNPGGTGISLGGGSGNLIQSIVKLISASYDASIGNGGTGVNLSTAPAGSPSSFTSPNITITAGGGAGGFGGDPSNGSAQGGLGGTTSAFTAPNNAILVSSSGVIAPGIPKSGNNGDYGSGGNIWSPSFDTPFHFLYPRSPVQNKGNGGSAAQNGGNPGQAGYVQIFYQIEPT